MLAQVITATVRGVDSILVRVEVNLSSGLPAFTVVGLAESSVREGRERVTAALRNAGFPLPPKRVTVNLAPADVPKGGSAFDLPLAVGLLAAAGHVPRDALVGAAFVGEVGLDGTLRPVRGALPVAARCARSGIGTLFLPAQNASEAAVVDGLTVLGAESLPAVARHLAGGSRLQRVRVDATALLGRAAPRGADLSDVRGQQTAKRALEVAAAGGHNLLLIGPPGAGKTMLARRIPGILPPLTLPEALEVTRVHSVSGLLRPGRALVERRPFRAPHQTVSEAGLVGGGKPLRPGEASLAHHGVLFLDELAEFRRNALEALRQPLEDGVVHLSRARARASFPARFLLVGAMNPCPCGYCGDGSDRCLCDPALVDRYRGKVSGPLLDRLDLHVEVPSVRFEALAGTGSEEASSEVASRVARARRVQQRRFDPSSGVFANGQMSAGLLRQLVKPSREGRRLLRRAVDRTGLSARAYHRVLKVARTVADLEGMDEVAEEHILEALQYRLLDRRPLGE